MHATSLRLKLSTSFFVSVMRPGEIQAPVVDEQKSATSPPPPPHGNGALLYTTLCAVAWHGGHLPVSCLPLREEDGVVEADILAARYAGHVLQQVVVLLGQSQPEHPLITPHYSNEVRQK